MPVLQRIQGVLAQLTGHDANPPAPSPLTAAAAAASATMTAGNMKALILVGGYGTRLRPLTFTVPKPLVEFANMPIISHQIEAAVKVGVKTVILAVNVQPDAMKEYIAEAEKKYGIRIIFSQEDVPMGTAGPLALPDAYNALTADDAPFFMFNSDVICDFPLESMLSFHRAHGGEGTILVTEVSDPSKYGVVVSDDKGQIQQFIEKPQVFVSNKINAGLYLFNVDILKRVPKGTPTSIERQVFPNIAAEKKLYSMVLPEYWMDIGQPKDYLIGQTLHLAFVRRTAPDTLTSGDFVRDNVLVHPTAKIGAGAVLGPDVVVGAGAVVEAGARVKRSTLLPGSVVRSHALVSSSIIGWKSTVGSHARVSECVLGEDVQIAPEIAVSEVMVCPHKGVGDNATGKIIM